jgi:hypothetical protein
VCHSSVDTAAAAISVDIVASTSCTKQSCRGRAWCVTVNTALLLTTSLQQLLSQLLLKLQGSLVIVLQRPAGAVGTVTHAVPVWKDNALNVLVRKEMLHAMRACMEADGEYVPGRENPAVGSSKKGKTDDDELAVDDDDTIEVGETVDDDEDETAIDETVDDADIDLDDA